MRRDLRGSVPRRIADPPLEKRQQEADYETIGARPVPCRLDHTKEPDDWQENFPVYRLRSGEGRAN